MIKTSCSLLVLASLLLAGPVLAQSTGLKAIDRLKIGGDGRWDYVTLDASAGKLYIAHESAISAYDLKTGTATPHLADAKGAHIALPIHGGADLLITHGKADIVTINDAVTGIVKATIKTDIKPDAAIIEPVTGKAFVMANGGSALDAIDLMTNTLIRRIEIGGDAEAAAVDGEGLVFSHLEDKNAFVAVDATTLTLKATHEMADCQEPSGIAFIPGDRLILSACQNGIARVSNADTGAEVATVPVGPRPDGALYDAKAKLGYIPSADGTLTVISFDGAPHVVDHIATKANARTGTLDADTGRIYLAAGDFGPLDSKTSKPTIIPGSLVVVVVGR
jgi:outer membrane protein assembly factor BamB